MKEGEKVERVKKELTCLFNDSYDYLAGRASITFNINEL